MNKYELSLLSFLNGKKEFVAYTIQDIQTIGVFGNEPYGIRLKNFSQKRIQVKIVIDGTDILTGKAANKSSSEDCWVVEAGGELQLNAWPETMSRGGRFVFTSAENSVAVCTRGDIHARQMITALVFEEGYNPPVYTTEQNVSWRVGRIDPRGFESSRGDEQLKSIGPMTGVGETIEQKIIQTKGLIQPIEGPLLQVRYLWWDDLKQLLKQEGVPQKTMYPTGFVEDRQLADLGKTPRLGSMPQPTTQEYQRLY